MNKSRAVDDRALRRTLFFAAACLIPCWTESRRLWNSAASRQWRLLRPDSVVLLLDRSTVKIVVLRKRGAVCVATVASQIKCELIVL